MKNIFPYPDAVNTYASYEVNDDLHKFLESFFKNDIRVRYQVIKKTLDIHMDVGEHTSKLNYIVQAGGDNVLTRWYDSVDSPVQIDSVCCQEKVWYDIDIKTPHDISEILHPRISITVKEISYG